MDNIISNNKDTIELMLNIDSKLYEEIKNYYNFNHIDNIKLEILHLIEIGFNVERFGQKPFEKFNHNEVNNVANDKGKEESNGNNEIIAENSEQTESKKRTRSVRIIKN